MEFYLNRKLVNRIHESVHIFDLFFGPSFSKIVHIYLCYLCREGEKEGLNGKGVGGGFKNEL